MAKLTPLSKGLITVVVVGVVGFLVYKNLDKIAPGKKDTQKSNVPPVAQLPDVGSAKQPDGTGTGPSAPVPDKPGCANLPEVRFYHWAWNAQMGLMYA